MKSSLHASFNHLTSVIEQITAPARAASRMFAFTDRLLPWLRVEEAAGYPCPVPEAPAYTVQYFQWLRWLHIQGYCILSRNPDKLHRWKASPALLYSVWDGWINPLTGMKFPEFCDMFTYPSQQRTSSSTTPETEAGQLT
jgi:hypothetical protein